MDINIGKTEVYSREQVIKIESEFSRIQEACYLDHAGATLYSEKQLESIFTEFSKNIYGNPHTKSLPSQNTVDCVDIVRYQILSHFNTSPEKYSVIFTSGATGALKLIAENFNYNGGYLAYLEDNHTSVLGMRAYAPNIREVKVDEAFSVLSTNVEDMSRNQKYTADKKSNSLFVYPAESNFSGAKYPLCWIDKVKNGIINPTQIESWFTVLDAATFVSTNKLDLTKYHPDFVTISFYKIFGYPTGLGALLVKKSSESVLEKKYYGGGTVLMAIASKNVMVPRKNIFERFEDGTLPFLSIISLRHGFDTLRRLSLTYEMISKHTFSLAQYTYHRLLELHHFNGNPVVVFYHDTYFDSIETQGGIVTFNFKRANGDYVGYAEVMHLANLHNVHLRTGCFCNPGACHRFLRLSPEDVRKQFEAGHICGDENDLINGFPTGAVRISFGYMSTYKCADRFLSMVESCFVTKPVLRRKRIADINTNFINNENKSNAKNFNKTFQPKTNNEVNGIDKETDPNMLHLVKGKLSKILVYPIKSCGSYCPERTWKITSTGFKYDRKWMIVNSSGRCVSQKQIRELCLIEPIIDVKKNKLRISYKGDFDFVEVLLDLQVDEILNKTNGYFCESKVCGDKIQGWDCGEDVAEWLEEKLGRPGLRMLRQCDFKEDIVGRSSKNDSQLSLANQGQFLLINTASIRWLKERIPESDLFEENDDSILLRFRPNLAVDFEEAFVENTLESFEIGNAMFQFSGSCTRCQMICIDQNTGQTSKEPLQTLSREMQGKLRFGVYLSLTKNTEGKSIEVGEIVNAGTKVLK